MSLQVCHCGWSKVTTYHGLRIHQGKMGCTPKGMRIPESQQLTFDNSLPKNSYTPVKLLPDVYNPTKADMIRRVCHCGWSKVTTYHGLRTHQGKMGCTPKGMRSPESQQLTFDNYLPKNSYNPAKLLPDVDNSTKADMSLQVCHCSWSKVTTYHGLRIHQGKMGCTPKGMRIPESQQLTFDNSLPKNSYTPVKLLPDVYNPTNADMSLQVCHCGWSKVTTYHGLRTHQGKMGCTPKGMRSPESQQLTFDNYLPKNSYNPAKLLPDVDNSTKADISLQVCHCSWSKVTTYHGLRIHQGKMGCTPKGMRIPESQQLTFDNSLPKNSYTPVKLLPDVYNPTKADMSLQVCHCGWSKVTTYHGLRTHQGKMGCTPKGMRIPESQQLTFDNSLPKNSYTPVKLLPDVYNPTKADMIRRVCHCGWSKVTTYHGLRTHQGKMGCTPKGMRIPESQQLTFDNYLPKNSYNPAKLLPDVDNSTKAASETPQRSFQTSTNSDKVRRTLDFSASVQHKQICDFSEHPAVEPKVSSYEPLLTNTQLLDCSSISLKVEQTGWKLPTTMAQITAPTYQKPEDDQEIIKVQRDKMRADLQQRIQIREEKVAEVTANKKAYKITLDQEWLEINSIFSEVINVVQDAQQKALQPLEERRRAATKEAKDVIQKTLKETDILKKSIIQLDRNGNLEECLQVCGSLPGLDGSRDWKKVKLNTSSSFGTLRTTTTTMMEEIHQKLDKLTAVELKRIPKFAVDVKLDPSTAHPCLPLSHDGKKVSDKGMNQEVPDAPGRFNLFGSIVAQNSLASAKSYWEVDVSNKTGWNLGVARANANRRGNLTLNPENGYWVTVHYKGKEYAALTTPPVLLSLKSKPQKVGVFVDYEEGLVSFYDINAKSHIYSFTKCAFNNELSPYFRPHH